MPTDLILTIDAVQPLHQGSSPKLLVALVLPRSQLMHQPGATSEYTGTSLL